MNVVYSFFDSYLVSFSSETIGIMIVCMCLVFAIILLLPVFAFRFQIVQNRENINLAPVYGTALRIALWINIVLSFLFSFAFFLTDLSKTNLKPAWHDRLVQNVYYPFADLLNYSLSQAKGSLATSPTVESVSVFFSFDFSNLNRAEIIKSFELKEELLY